MNTDTAQEVLDFCEKLGISIDAFYGNEKLEEIGRAHV